MIENVGCGAAAIEYARLGWYVLPLWWPDASAPSSVSPPTSKNPTGRVLGGCACRVPTCPSPGKHPIGPLVGEGKDNASNDVGVVAGWFSRYPGANVGIATERSGIIVLDVDVAEGKPGRASLAQIDSQLTPTRSAMTGSGGLHAVFQRPADVEAFTRIGALPGLDIIGDGYIVAAPSRHKSGGTYRWNNALPLTPMPAVLRELRRARVDVTAADVGTAKIGEGGRNAAMFRLGASIRATGVDRDAVRAVMVLENARRFDPPLPDDEVEQLVNKVMRHAKADRDVAMGSVVSAEFSEMFPSGTPSAEETPESATIAELLPVLEAESKLPVAHLPFQKLDDKLGGLSVHSSTLLIGGTGKGKSSLAGQIAVHHARHFGPGVYYVGEMTRSLVVARVAGQALGRSWIDVVRGRVAWSEVARALDGLPMIFVKRSDNPMRAIAAALDRTVKLGWQGIPMIIADYIQIMASIGQDMRLGVAGTVRDLQRFVEAAPVISLELSQTSRAGARELRDGVQSAEQGQGKGAETSELENGATNVLTISYASKDGATEHDVTVLLGKGRFGGGDKFGFKFNGKTGLWTATDKPPTDEDHEERIADVLAQLMIHHSGRCMGGSQPCGKDLTPAALYTPRSPHKITGTKDQILRAVEDAIDMGRVMKMGPALLPGK